MAGHFYSSIEHNGEDLDVEVSWDSEDGYGITGLCFNVMSIGDRKATQEEAERLDEELGHRMDTETEFCTRISASIYDSHRGEY